MSAKTCSVCQTEKPKENFSKQSRKCYQCTYAASRVKRLQISKEKPNPYRRTTEGRLFYKYGITLKERDELISAQGGSCAICRSSFDVNIPRSANVDHCHATGQIRGVLCRNCNCMIGLAGDSIEVLQAAITYLEKSGKNL